MAHRFPPVAQYCIAMRSSPQQKNEKAGSAIEVVAVNIVSLGRMLNDKAIAQDMEIAKADLLSAPLIFIEAQQPFSNKANLNLCVMEDEIRIDLTGLNNAVLFSGSIPKYLLHSYIKDYRIICEAHGKALSEGGCSRIEAVDAGRRALHNEAADFLISHLNPPLMLDHAFGRKLFTLISLAY